MKMLRRLKFLKALHSESVAIYGKKPDPEGAETGDIIWNGVVELFPPFVGNEFDGTSIALADGKEAPERSDGCSDARCDIEHGAGRHSLVVAFGTRRRRLPWSVGEWRCFYDLIGHSLAHILDEETGRASDSDAFARVFERDSWLFKGDCGKAPREFYAESVWCYLRYNDILKEHAPATWRWIDRTFDRMALDRMLIGYEVNGRDFPSVRPFALGGTGSFPASAGSDKLKAETSDADAAAKPVWASEAFAILEDDFAKMDEGCDIAEPVFIGKLAEANGTDVRDDAPDRTKDDAPSRKQRELDIPEITFPDDENGKDDGDDVDPMSLMIDEKDIERDETEERGASDASSNDEPGDAKTTAPLSRTDIENAVADAEKYDDGDAADDVRDDGEPLADDDCEDGEHQVSDASSEAATDDEENETVDERTVLIEQGMSMIDEDAFNLIMGTGNDADANAKETTAVEIADDDGEDVDPVLVPETEGADENEALAFADGKTDGAAVAGAVQETDGDAAFGAEETDGEEEPPFDEECAADVEASEDAAACHTANGDGEALDTVSVADFYADDAVPVTPTVSDVKVDLVADALVDKIDNADAPIEEPVFTEEDIEEAKDDMTDTLSFTKLFIEDEVAEKLRDDEVDEMEIIVNNIGDDKVKELVANGVLDGASKTDNGAEKAEKKASAVEEGAATSDSSEEKPAPKKKRSTRRKTAKKTETENGE